MKRKRILKLILMLLFLFPVSAYAFGHGDDTATINKMQTTSACKYSKSECETNQNCTWIEEHSCGINLSNQTYTCYYYYEYSSIHTLVTAHFNTNGLSSLEYDTDDPMNDGNKSYVNGKQTPQIVTEKSGLSYYTCPKTLWYSVNDTKTKEEDNTIVHYRYFSTEKKDNSDIAYSLLKKDDFNGIMAINKLPDSYNQEIEVEPTVDPLTCSYTKEVGNDKRTITITYHDKDNVSINYTGIAVSGLGITTNAEFIKQSEYFKNWQCPSENEVYAYVDENNTLIVSYNESDLGNHSNIFKYEGNSSSNDSDGSNYNGGTEVNGCEVVPPVVKKWIKVALNFVKYVALVLVIILGTLDFIKAAGSGEPDAMKKAGQVFIKRVVAVIILFLLPMIVELLLNLIDLYGANTDCFGVLE